EDLKRFNYTERDLIENKYNEDFINLMKHECIRARFFYTEANKSLTKEDKGLMFAARIMEHIYFRVLKKIENKSYNVFNKKVQVSKLKKIYITAGVFIKYKLLYSFDEQSLAINGK
ncbi:MAG: squalene/phytoene synthase family protein, partial [bacterium]